MKELALAIDKVGSLTITTLDKETMHSRIISLCGCDDDGIYFLTMNVKPFYKQLKNNPQVSLCGIYPSGRKEGINKDGQPYWPPGFFLRLNAQAHEVDEDEIKEKASKGSSIHQYALEDIERYPAMRLFCIKKGKGEIFDYDFELEQRDHKLERKRFAFGGAVVNPAGMKIDPDVCITCGACFEACSFSAVEEGDESYKITSERCDECGSCMLACPVEAIECSQTM